MVKDSENGGTERKRRGDRAYHGGQCRLEARGVAAACVQFACTVAIAVLMNINKQAKEGGEDGEE